jgi:hypothetical protein
MDYLNDYASLSVYGARYSALRERDSVRQYGYCTSILVHKREVRWLAQARLLDGDLDLEATLWFCSSGFRSLGFRYRSSTWAEILRERTLVGPVADGNINDLRWSFALSIRSTRRWFISLVGSHDSMSSRHKVQITIVLARF